MDVYVNYKGTCEEAFRFYEQHLGGRILGIKYHRDMKESFVPPEFRDKVVHAQIEIGNATLMGADIPNAEPMRSAYVTLTVDQESEAERLYQLLSDGGEIFMKMQTTSYANRFAMWRDRFGTSWMLLQDPTDV
jgi:PhnB protein